jgi:hypothetical protein
MVGINGDCLSLLIAGVIQLVQSTVTADEWGFAGGAYRPEYYVRCFAGFFLAYQLAALFFASQPGADHRENGELHAFDRDEAAGTLWSLLSGMLNFSLVYLGVGIKVAFNASGDSDTLDVTHQNMFAGSAFASLSIITLMRMQHKVGTAKDRPDKPYFDIWMCLYKGLMSSGGNRNRRFMYGVRFAISAIPLVALFGFREACSSTTVMTLVLFFTVTILVFLDGFSKSKSKKAAKRTHSQAEEADKEYGTDLESANRGPAAFADI